MQNQPLATVPPTEAAIKSGPRRNPHTPHRRDVLQADTVQELMDKYLLQP